MEYEIAQSQRWLPFIERDDLPDNLFLNSASLLEEMEIQLCYCKNTALGPDEIAVSLLKWQQQMPVRCCL